MHSKGYCTCFVCLSPRVWHYMLCGGHSAILAATVLYEDMNLTWRFSWNDCVSEIWHENKWKRQRVPQVSGVFAYPDKDGDHINQAHLCSAYTGSLAHCCSTSWWVTDKCVVQFYWEKDSGGSPCPSRSIKVQLHLMHGAEGLHVSAFHFSRHR